MTDLLPATGTGRLKVEKRRDANGDYRRLLNRWVVAAGKEHEKLANLTLLVLDGEEYDAAIGRVAQGRNEIPRD